MKAIIEVNVPDFQIGQEVSIYFKDTMMIKGIVQEPKTGEWIPVSERLPEDSELVLFSTKTDRVFEGRYFADNTDCQWYAFRDECFAFNNVVTAWMPLPEPYKAERSE